MRRYRFCGPRDYGKTEGIKFGERKAQRTVLSELVSGANGALFETLRTNVCTFESVCSGI